MGRPCKDRKWRGIDCRQVRELDLAGWAAQLDPGRLAYSSNVYYEVIISLPNQVSVHLAQSVDLFRTLAQSVTHPSTVALN